MLKRRYRFSAQLFVRGLLISVLLVEISAVEALVAYFSCCHEFGDIVSQRMIGAANNTTGNITTQATG